MAGRGSFPGQVPHRRVRVASLACVVAVAISAALRGPPAGADDAAVDEVHYTFTGPTSVAFDWRGASDELRYGPTADYGTTVLGIAPSPLPFSSTGPYREAEVTGLDPGTTYHYSIGGSADATFSTAPTGNYRFDVEADVGTSTRTQRAADTQAQIAVDAPAFVLMLGDIVYVGNKGIETVDQHFDDVMPWSRTAAYMPAWGNHESVAPDDLRNYKGRFEIPNAQTSPGSPAIACCGEDWGWFDAGGVRFISYPEPWPGALADWASEVAPIMDAAQNDPSINFIVTFGHRPAYSTGKHPGDAELASITGGLGQSYSKYVLNLNGHSHDYERFQPIDGVTHITAGGGGVGLEGPWRVPPAPTTAFRAMRLEHLRVDVTPTALHIEAVCGTRTKRDDVECEPGSILDAITIGEEAPRARLDVLADEPLHVSADASSSSDADATPIDTFDFDWGDGTSTGPQTSSTSDHAYAEPGPYTVTVTVADTVAQSTSAQQEVDVTEHPNLLSNSGFESGTGGWGPVGRSSILAPGSDAYMGTGGADVSNGGTSSVTCGIQTVPDAVTTTEPTTYEGSLWARSDAPGASLKLRFRELEGSFVVGTKVRTVPLSASWQQVEVRYTSLDPGVSSLNLRAYVTAAPPGPCFSVDDAVLHST
ncbi:MAG: PKD domain-containing protein [Actinomycetota bacterium]